MINIVSCPNDKIGILSLNYILQPPKSSAHGNVTSSVISPISRPCISFCFSLFLSATWRFSTLSICAFQIASVHMSVWNLKHLDWIRVILLRVLAVNLWSVFYHILLKVLLVCSFKVNIVAKSQFWTDIVWIHRSFKKSWKLVNLLDQTTYAYESKSYPQNTWSHTATEQICFTPATIG